MEPSHTPARAMTIEEWADLDEDEEGELVDGVLEEEEAPSWLHAEVVAWLLFALGAWVTPRGGAVYGSEGKFRVSRTRGRKPDLSVYLPGRPRPSANASATRRPPSIAIEVLSPRPRDARRDRVDKKRDYAGFGVPFYWIVDPMTRTLEVFELDAKGRYADALSASDGAHPIPGCEELVLDLDALWAALDALDREDEPEE